MGSNYNILTVLVTLTVLKRKVEAMGCIFPFVISSCTQNIFLLVTHLLAFYVTMRILCFSFQSKSLPADKHTNTYSKARCLFLPGKNHNYQRTSLMIIHVCFKFPSVFNIICAFSRKVVAGEIPNRWQSAINTTFIRCFPWSHPNRLAFFNTVKTRFWKHIIISNDNT